VIDGGVLTGSQRALLDAASFGAGLQVPVLTGPAVPASARTAYRPLTEALLRLLRGREIPDDAAMAT